MAIKVKKEVININDELNRELENYGFTISFDSNDKKEENKDKKKEEKKTTKKK